MDHQPRDKRPELRGREYVHFEHPHGMRTDRAIEDGVDS
jgi:hypothetical protein